MASGVYFCYGEQGCGQRDCGPVCSYKKGVAAAPAGGAWGLSQAECPGDGDDDGEGKRVEFFVDGVSVHNSTEHVPTRAGESAVHVVH